MSKCDLNNCKNKAIRTFEDMADGEWLALCKQHITELKKAGQLFGDRVDLR